jgi:hypothetical protein
MLDAPTVRVSEMIKGFESGEILTTARKTQIAGAMQIAHASRESETGTSSDNTAAVERNSANGDIQSVPTPCRSPQVFRNCGFADCTTPCRTSRISAQHKQRPTIGDQVRIIETSTPLIPFVSEREATLTKIGTVVEVDKSDMPFKICVDGEELWYCEDCVELEEVIPSPSEKPRDNLCGVLYWPALQTARRDPEGPREGTFGTNFNELFVQTRAFFERSFSSGPQDERRIFVTPRLHGGRRPTCMFKVS